MEEIPAHIIINGESDFYLILINQMAIITGIPPLLLLLCCK
jgi:hypothetical protein